MRVGITFKGAACKIYTPFLRRRRANVSFAVREFVRSLSIYYSLAHMCTVKHSLFIFLFEEL